MFQHTAVCLSGHHHAHLYDTLDHVIARTSVSLRILYTFPDMDKWVQDPITSWVQVHRVLCDIYAHATTLSMHHNKPLLDTRVILEGWCNYTTGLWPELEAVMGTRVQVAGMNAQRAHLSLPSLVPIQPLDHSASVLVGDPPLTSPTPELAKTWRAFQHVAVGGTFDHLHAGHKILLTLSAWIAKTRLFVGVTGHELLVNKLHKETMQSLDERINNVTAFLGEMHQGLQYQVECIHDAYGPTITDASFTALVVSKETEKGGKSVLVERGKCGMPAMELFVIDVLGGHGDKMSSSWIRGYLAAQ